MRKRILFVDDEPFVLAALKRLLRSHRDLWDVEFAESGPLALQKMDQQRFDVIVTDIRMPEMDGPQLLAEVRKRHPRTVRIILSGQSDEDVGLRAAGPAHQYLSKPCDPKSLKNAVTRACMLRDRLKCGSLRRLISQIDALPSLPHIYQELVREIRSEDGSIERAAEIIAGDIGMTVKVLQLVNSSFFGPCQRTSNPRKAVKWLGMKKIEALALSSGVFYKIDDNQLGGLDFQKFGDHSLAVAGQAQYIANQVTGKVEDGEDAFLAGMLHDVGKLILASNLPEEYQAAMDLATKRPMPLWQAELETFNASHSDVGAYLVGLWGLPDPIIEAIAFHHDPSKALVAQFSPLTAVHVANALKRNAGASNMACRQQVINREYLRDLGLLDRIPQWQ